MYARHPAVVRLQVHLPGEQLVFFTADGAIGDQVQWIKATRKIILTKFFTLNALIKSKERLTTHREFHKKLTLKLIFDEYCKARSYMPHDYITIALILNKFENN